MSALEENLSSTTLRSASYPGGPRRLFYYRKDTSDEKVMQEIFRRQEYDIVRFKRGTELNALYARMAGSSRKPLIIDAGANIGASAVWFASKFPAAHIIAIEPETENYRLLELNTKGLNVRPIKAAIGAKEGAVTLVDPGEGAWGYRTSENISNPSAPNSIRKVTVNQLYQRYAETHAPFLVKLDIEGAESELFSAETSWVAQTPLIIIELHDWLFPGAANSQNFLRCISQLNRDFVYVGENVFSIDNKI